MTAPHQRSHTSQSVITGIAAALIGYTSTFAVVLTGLQTVGADRRHAATGLVALCFAIGVVSLTLSSRYRMPLTIAWSTPGAAVLVSAGQITGGWSAAVGAFIIAALLVVLTGMWPLLGRLVAAIPAPIAQAMLAGILLDLCLTPVSAVAEFPAQVAELKGGKDKMMGFFVGQVMKRTGGKANPSLVQDLIRRKLVATP